MTILKYFIITIILLLHTTVILAQDDVNFPIRIDEVQIVGNERTKDHVILREIPYSFPDTLSKAALIIIPTIFCCLTRMII